jgi:WD40 repeat protein/Cdc6-like AAA superfamily ATPase
MASRTFRIFVSSTFSDLKEERNALQKDVFPRLRELCMQYGCRFQAIDLRWGVREEAALDQQTMRICLEEIRRCQKVTPRPNFIVLLGDRYGWRPLPYEIPADEFEQIISNISDEGERVLLKSWYWRDDNAVPPVYDLQPRTGDFINSLKWESVEKEIRSILLKAIKDLPSGDEQRLKYTASATEQEIVYGALKVPDAKEHVFCFFRTIKDIPQDESAKDFIDLDEKGKLNIDTQEQLYDLKNRLYSLLPGNIHDYEAELNNKGVTTKHLDKLCEDVYNSLSKVILEEVKRIKEVDPLEKEIEDHDVFGKERTKFFVGRVDILNKIDEYIRSVNNYPLAIYGGSGSGKTALMAKAVEQAQRKYQDFEIIFRYIGATPSSSDGRSLLESVCKQIYKAFDFEEQKKQRLAEIEGYDGDAKEKRNDIEKEYEIPSEFQKLSDSFREFLKEIPADKKLILFLDALDQLSDADHARSLYWLPDNIPENVRIVVSTLPGECLTILERKVTSKSHSERGEESSLIIKLVPLSLNEGDALLDLWLADAQRRLQDDQRKSILSKLEKCGLPLYLKLAFEEARRWKSYSPKIELSSDISGIIRDLFRRLSLDANHGEVIVSQSLSYLSVAKNGLTEDEMLDVLSLDNDVFDDFKKRAKHDPPEERLPVIVWSRLYFDLEPYLTERAADGMTLMSFYHRQLGEIVVKDYLFGEEKLHTHRSLANYFGDQPHWIKTDKPRISNLRKMSELPYQQTYGKMWSELESTLCDLLFIEAKCAGGMTYDLIEDYNRALDALPEAQDEKQKELEHKKWGKKYVDDLVAYAKWDIKELDTILSVRPWTEEEIMKDTERIINNPTRLDRIKAFSQFVNSESHGLLKFGHIPGFCLQQAYNSANSGPVAKASEDIIDASTDRVLLLHLPAQRVSYNPNPARMRVLEGHTDVVKCVSITSDGNRVISGSQDKTLRIWDLESGRCINTLEGHTDDVECVSITPDGDKAISGSRDKTLRVWDVENGKCLNILEGHTRSILCVNITADGSAAISGSQDSTLRLWDLENGQCIRIFEGHKAPVINVSITPDRRKAVSGSGDTTLRMWNIASGQCIRIIEDQSPVTSVIITPDGKKVVSAGTRSDIYIDRTLRVWDPGSGQCLKTLEGHERAIKSISISRNGKTAVSGSGDGTLRVWDLESGSCIKTFKGHKDEIESVSITPDAKIAVSGSADRTIRVWDLEQNKCIKTFEAHGCSVASVSITPDGSTIISGSSCQVKRDDNTIKVWGLNKGQLIKSISKGTAYSTENLSITPDGRIAITAGGGFGKTFWTCPLFVWNLATGQLIKIIEGHDFPIKCVVITPDGKIAISGGDDKTLRMWDIEKGQLNKTHQPYKKSVDCVSILPDGKKAVSMHKDGIIRIWNLETGRCIRKLDSRTKKVEQTEAAFVSLSFSQGVITPDGKKAVSKHKDGTIHVWNLENGKDIKTLEVNTGLFLAFTPDNRRMISTDIGRKAGTMLLLDGESGRCIKKLKGHKNSPNKVLVTPDGRKAISIESFDLDFLSGKIDFGSSEKIMIWDLESGQRLQTLEGHKDLVQCIGITPDGRTIISGSRDKTIRIWSLESGQAIKTLEGAASWVNNITITPDGKKAISESDTLRVWRLKIGKCVKTIEGDHVSILPDAKKALSSYGLGYLLLLSDLEIEDYYSVYGSHVSISSLSNIHTKGIFACIFWSGEFVIFRIIDPLIETPIITPYRLWLFGKDCNRGVWDKKIKASCKWCGQRFAVTDKILDIIKGINREAGLTPDQSPCLELPDEAWDEPRLLSECPHCHKPLKFNPFIVDNSDRY